MKNTFKLKTMALLALLFLTAANAMAHTVTVNVDTGGRWRYRFNGAGSWSSYFTGSWNIEVEDGATLNLAAALDPSLTGYYFVRWFEDDTSVSTGLTYNPVITSDRTFKAEFTTEHYTMTVNNNGGGRLRIFNGASWSSYFYGTNATCEVGAGARCTVEATKYNDNYFVNYTEDGEVASTNYSYAFDMEADRTLTANFTTETCQITFTALPNHPNPDESGSYIFDGGQVGTNGCIASGWKAEGPFTQTVAKGGLVSLRNSPYTDYILQSWIKDGETVYTGSGNYDFYAQEDASFTAKFVTYYTNTFTESATLYVTNVDQSNGDGTYKFQLSADGHPGPDDPVYEYFRYIIVNTEGINVKFIFNTTQPVGFLGYFRVGANGGTLEMELSENYASSITLIRAGGFSSDAFQIIRPSDDAEVEYPLDSRQMIISGKDPEVADPANDTSTYLPTRQFVIDGGCGNVTAIEGPDDITVTCDKMSYEVKNLIRHAVGILSLSNVTLQNHCSSKGTYGVIWMGTGGRPNEQETKASSKLELTHCLIHNNVARSYGQIRIQFNIKYVGTEGSEPSATLERCKFTKNYFCTTDGSVYQVNGSDRGCIASYSGNMARLTIDHCTFYDNFNSAITWRSPNTLPCQISHCLVKKNKAYYILESTDTDPFLGGGITIKARAEITACEIRDNWAQRYGGGIFFSNLGLGRGTIGSSGGYTIYKPISPVLSLDEATVVENNTAGISGGGVAVMTQRLNVGDVFFNHDAHGNPIGQYSVTFDQNGATIRDNTAGESGGGVFISRTPDATFFGLNCFLNEGTLQGNTAGQNGGGLCITQEKNAEEPWYDLPALPQQIYAGDLIDTLLLNDGKPWRLANIVPQDVYVHVSKTGADKAMNLLENTAINGAGIYLDVEPINYHDINATNVVEFVDYLGNTTTYNIPTPDHESTTHTTVHDYAVVKDNTASQNGGGIYVEQGEINILSAAPETHRPLFDDNKALNAAGGGVYLAHGVIRATDAIIQNNTANTHGGGIYLDDGFITITTSDILTNTARINGGGINDHSGDIFIYGGHISHNTATIGRGGGIYTNAGDIRIWPSALYNNPNPAPSLAQCEATGTTFSYNKAGTNGGGLNTHIGRLDVRFAKVLYNEAGTTYGFDGQGPDGQGATGSGGSGGGMFCEGPHADLSGYTVRLIHTDLKNNTAFGNSNEEGNLTGRGGGLYLKYGSIFAEHCEISFNKADINGGGLDNHDGELRVYGSFVDHNEARTGRGGGLYTQKGNLVVGPCDTYGFDESKASSIYNNFAKINGGGINNHEGNITIHGDRINENEAETGGGGGVYINSGNIYMYGGQINNNKADNGKGGGVYSGGGTFKIMEREAHPILEILEVENIATDGFTVHFHHVDRGYAMEEGASDKEFGIAFSENSYPPELGENEYWGDNWDCTIVNFIPTDENPLPEEPLYIQDEGCSRFVASGLSPEKTYYVVAYGKYTYGGKNYFDASPVVTVKTHGDKPVVVSGVAFDVTASSASVNAKLFYKGIGDVTVTSKGFQLSADGGSTWGPQCESPSVGDVFSYTFEDLSANTSYNIRAYATNSAGHTGYSEGIIQFTTLDGSKAMGNSFITQRNTYSPVEENPFSKGLTPLQQAIVASSPESDSIVNQRGTKEGEYDKPVNVPRINFNTADYGGGIYMTNSDAQSPTLLVFSGGNSDDTKGRINLNYADRSGGGIYIDEHAYMQMTGYCEVNGNRVPADSLGGGIYLAGRLYVGNPDDGATANSLQVNQNFAFDANSQNDFLAAYVGHENTFTSEHKFNRNNVYLPKDTYSYATGNNTNTDDNSNVITLLADISAKKTETEFYSNIGFSVPHGYCPVITTAAEFRGDYLKQGDENFSTIYEPRMSNLMPSAGGTAWSTSALFDDSESHIAIHTVTDIDPFRAKYIFLWGSWTNPKVDEDPQAIGTQMLSGDGTHYRITKDENNILHWEIYSPEGLSWFSSYINGLNAFATDAPNDGVHDDFKYNANITPYATAKLMNDIDMSAAFWVPLGSVTSYNGAVYIDNNENEHTFKGTFNGQGHVITGLDCRFLTGVLKYGLFGKLDGNAVVENVFIDDSKYMTIDKTAPYYVGGVAGVLSDNATISASEARVEMDVNKADKARSYVGGLVGKMEGNGSNNNPVIHSSMAMPEIKGSVLYIGGLVGQLGANCNLFNSFSNPKFPDPSYVDTCWTKAKIVGENWEPDGNDAVKNIYFGGLVGENNGIVENCYSRLQTDAQSNPPIKEPIGGVNYNNVSVNNYNKSVFGWLAGTNYATINYCYGAKEKMDSPGVTDGGKYIKTGTDPSGHGTYTATQRYSGKYGFKHRDHKITAAEIDENEYTTLLITDIDDAYESGLTNQSFGGGGSNSGNNGSTSPQPATLSTTTSGGLMTILNAWVELNYKANEAGKDYATWTRTMASPINDDYPVPMLTDFNSVGSKDKIYLLYEDDVNHMWNPNEVSSTGIITKPGKNFAACNTEGSVAAMYLYDVQPILNAATGNAPAVYATVDISGNNNVPLYINEDIGITQPDKDVDDNIPALTARAGVTIKNVREDGDDYTHDPNWHLFSSAIKEVPIGIGYHTRAATDNYVSKIVWPNGEGIQKSSHDHDTWADRTQWDPPRTSWLGANSTALFNYNANTSANNNVGYFPTNTPYGTWRSTPYTDGSNANNNEDVGFFDLYEYNEYYYHWINYKREGTSDIQDHWHWDKDGVDAKHYRLGWDKSEKARYFNDTEWVPGKGYLMALSSESMMMADGILNTGNVTIGATKTAEHINLPPNGHGTYNYTTEWRALNMIGNPYQSYLDFDKFVEGSNNGDILGGTKEYAVADDSKDLSVKNRYRYYVYRQSENSPYSASRYIHPHQGFFVKAASSGDITFNNDMRVAGKIIINNVNNNTDNNVNSPYRGDRNYPLVNLLCYDEDGRRDLTTVEVNRPEFGGGHKMEKLHESKGLIYAHLENESFQTLFTPVGVNVVPVRFVPNEDGIFTLNWNTRHG